MHIFTRAPRLGKGEPRIQLNFREMMTITDTVTTGCSITVTTATVAVPRRNKAEIGVKLRADHPIITIMTIRHQRERPKTASITPPGRCTVKGIRINTKIYTT